MPRSVPHHMSRGELQMRRGRRERYGRLTRRWLQIFPFSVFISSEICVSDTSVPQLLEEQLPAARRQLNPRVVKDVSAD
ncbi:hypothetical protein ROHU_029532 [Labeo rohita]|uniref:Uncharacterized protein n=1 Tax=Labeo rohita TaxID=84645 RepID=A0A498LYD8_LABRO|nr:hypothetical protein ROHU_029532 [Labeo rohita]